MTKFGQFLHLLLWPSVVLILGIYFAIILQVYLVDQNKVAAATNRATCELGFQKDTIDPKQMCKEIFDSARR